jgi:hypothetical protein
LSPQKRFFWFGVFIPEIPFIASGGGICIFTRVNDAGDFIQPTTGGVKFQPKLFDVLLNYFGPPMRKLLSLVIKFVRVVGFGWSIDNSLTMSLDGMPPLVANARRRQANDKKCSEFGDELCPADRCVPDSANKSCKQPVGTNPPSVETKEYFWGCSHHSQFAFPLYGFEQYDPYCNKLNGNVWLHISFKADQLFKAFPKGKNGPKPDSKPPVLTRQNAQVGEKPLKRQNAQVGEYKNRSDCEAACTGTEEGCAPAQCAKFNDPFKISDLFAFNLDIHLQVSIDDWGPSPMLDMKMAIMPVTAVDLFLTFMRLDFGFLATGNLLMTVQLSTVSAGILKDLMINLGNVLLYFRKAGNTGAFYITFSLGEAANDMEKTWNSLGDTHHNMGNINSLAESVGDAVYKEMLNDEVKDMLAGDQPSPFLAITGLQLQLYGILTGCTGVFPHW